MLCLKIVWADWMVSVSEIPFDRVICYNSPPQKILATTTNGAQMMPSEVPLKMKIWRSLRRLQLHGLMFFLGYKNESTSY